MAQDCSCIKVCDATEKTTTSCSGGNCLIATHLFVHSSESFNICQETGQIDLKLTTSACGVDPVNIVLTSQSDNIVVSSLTTESAMIAAVENPTTNFFELAYKVSCGSKSALGSICGYFADPCSQVSCTAGQECNSCTGLCEDGCVDLSTSLNPFECSVEEKVDLTTVSANCESGDCCDTSESGSGVDLNVCV